MEEAPDLATATRELYAAMSSGNADAVEERYSLGSLCVFVGTDAREVWTNSLQHNADVRHFFDGSSGKTTWEAGTILARKSGEFGWVFDQPTLRFTDGSTMQLRVTLAWLREGERWKVVHSHASVGGS